MMSNWQVYCDNSDNLCQPDVSSNNPLCQVCLPESSCAVSNLWPIIVCGPYLAPSPVSAQQIRPEKVPLLLSEFIASPTNSSPSTRKALSEVDLDSVSTCYSPRSDMFDTRMSEVSSDNDGRKSASPFVANVSTSTCDQQDDQGNRLCVKNTFITVIDEEETQVATLSRSESAPSIMCTAFFQRKRNPKMEEAHWAGVCRPCAYFTNKHDGCRWGTECPFCHLCTADDVKTKRKEKVKALKAEALAKKEPQPPQSAIYWRHRKERKSAAKRNATKTS
mmetsp:Transcript_44938/g.81017  ORF Transcript_44938/g.81017 Transcript_44938/m.81017 type:complete len:277 (-) Transcript_44938:83-913(-)